MELKDRWVNFRIRDVYVPDPEILIFDLHADDVLHGKIVDTSDSGDERDTFAVIQVQGIKPLVIVPVKSLRLEG